MKKIILIVVLVLLPLIANAEIGGMPFDPGEFEIEIYQYPHMILIDNPESQQVDTYYTFTNTDGDYQVRYSFFRQTNRDDPNIRFSYSVMIMMVVWNIAGHEDVRIVNFDDSDVLEEFNGDFGNTAFIENPVSDFATGFKYIMVNTFYKENQGIVVQSILVNDRNIFQTHLFLDLIYSFSFHD